MKTKIKNALISVSDKENLTLLLKILKKFNIKKFHAILIHRSSDLTTIYGKQIIKVLSSLKKKKN